MKDEWQYKRTYCPAKLDNVRAYIDNQVEHHQKKTFAEEYEEFIRKYGFKMLG